MEGQFGLEARDMGREERGIERRAGSPSHEREEGEENQEPLTPALSPRGGEREGGFGVIWIGRGMRHGRGVGV